MQLRTIGDARWLIGTALGKLVPSVCLMLTLLVAGSAFSGASASDAKRVMLLYSFGREFRPWSEYAKTIRSELNRQTHWPLEIIEQSLVTARYGSDDLEGPFADYLEALVARHPLDLIVSIGAPAAAFVERHRQQIFANTPMVFTAVEQRRLRFSTLSANDAVVAVAHDLPAVIDNILHVLPGTRTIAIVNGNSPLEKFWRAEIEREFKPFEARVTFKWFTALSFEEMTKQAATLPSHSAIFWELLIVDGAGVVYEGDAALTKLHAVANAPIFSFDDSFFGNELVGGPMHSVLEVSHITAAAAVRILGGELPGDISVPPIGFARPKFDWREMQRWNIAESRLPAGSEIYFRPPSIWEQYRWHAIGIGAVVLVQAALIFLLICEQHRRRSAEVLARNSIAELTYMNRIAAAGELSGTIAHEVNQPLTGITTRANAALRWLSASTPDLDKVRAALLQIVDAGHRASEIITNVRAMFRKDSPDKGPVDINNAIQMVLHLVRIELEKHDIEVRLQLGDRLPSVSGIEVQLQQVILNLTMNAIEAVQSAETRVLTVRSSFNKHHTIYVSIEDSGTGIDPAQRDRIFQPLFTTKQRGMGMGLSICASIIANHGGRISVSPGLMKGSNFHFELPAAIQWQTPNLHH
jgi:signal transduction histidine kinase